MAKKISKSQAKKVKKVAKKHPKIIIAIAVLVLIIAVALIVLWFVKPDIYHKFLGIGDHDFEDWKTVTQATCTEPGERQRTCKICGEREKEEIEAGHTWEDWQVVDEPDCAVDGLRSHTCSVCSEEEEEEIPALGHTWGDWSNTAEPTCYEKGLKEHICSVCNTPETQPVPATGLHIYDPDDVCETCHHSKEELEVAPTIENSDLSIHFLELGNKYVGDCTLIKYGDTEILIDAGSRQNSAITIKNYVDEYCNDGVLEYVIATHAHQDHIAGFVGTKQGDGRTGILYQYEVGTLIQFAGTNATSSIYKNYCTAVDYVKGNGTAVYTAKQCWYETDGAQKTYYLDEENNISLNILYQRYYEESTSDENDYSVCVLLTQVTHDKTYNYLFTGDLEEKGESSLVDGNSLPEVDLFKGGHHGSYTASTDKLLSVIKPRNVAVCCCCGTTEYTSNKDNTFPAQAFIDRVSKYTQNIYCTTLMIDYKKGTYASMNGNIVFYTKNGKLYLECSNNDIILKETDWFKENRTWNGI